MLGRQSFTLSKFSSAGNLRTDPRPGNVPDERDLRSQTKRDRAIALELLFVVVVEQVAEVFLLTAVVLRFPRGCGSRLVIVIVGESAWSFFSSIFARSFFNQTTQFVGQVIFVWHDSTRRTIPFTAHWNGITNTVFASIFIRMQEF